MDMAKGMRFADEFKQDAIAEFGGQPLIVITSDRSVLQSERKEHPGDCCLQALNFRQRRHVQAEAFDF